MVDPVRIGVLGAANIARAFTAGCRPSTEVAVVAVASRDAAKARAFATEVGIPRQRPLRRLAGGRRLMKPR